jgi:peptidoglycan biosynthesis protein MviN/MurJ (putative lipid II flippase)
MAAVKGGHLAARGRTLAALQALQVGSGLAGQLVLLARWSPDIQTDLFLLLSGVPWVASAAVLITGLELALPAAIHRARAAGGDPAVRHLVRRVARLSVLASALAALLSGGIVAGWAAADGLSPNLSAWMGAAMGAQVIPAALAGLWRGVLIAGDRLVRARITLLAGSLLTVAGYGLLPGPAARALPLTALGAVLLGAALAAWYTRAGTPVDPPDVTPPPHTIPLTPLLRALVALSAAAGLAHLQTLIERAAVRPLATGAVTALTVAGRGWEAVIAVIVAAAVMPAYPRWADAHAHQDRATVRALRAWSLRRAVALSVIAAAGIGAAVAVGLAAPPLHTWASGEQAGRMALVLLPRFVLVSSLQPLILKHYAAGTPWWPVLGSALGVGVLAFGAWTVIPCWELPGVALVTALSVLPGWGVLLWRERHAA